MRAGVRAAGRPRAAARALTRCHLRSGHFSDMITNRSLRFALCAFLLLAPLATLAAQESNDMGNDGFYLSASYGVALPAEREILDETPDMSGNFGLGTQIGFLGGQIGVGYAIAGFRPEISFGYRTVSIESLKFKKFMGSTADAVLKQANDVFAKEYKITGTVTSLDVAGNVYYDIDTGTEITPYIGVGGGVSNVSLKIQDNPQPPWS